MIRCWLQLRAGAARQSFTRAKTQVTVDAVTCRGKLRGAPKLVFTPTQRRYSSQFHWFVAGGWPDDLRTCLSHLSAARAHAQPRLGQWASASCGQRGNWQEVRRKISHLRLPFCGSWMFEKVAWTGELSQQKDFASQGDPFSRAGKGGGSTVIMATPSVFICLTVLEVSGIHGPSNHIFFRTATSGMSFMSGDVRNVWW